MSGILKRVSSPSTTTPAPVVAISTQSPAELDETHGLFRSTREYASEIDALANYVMEKGDSIHNHKVS